MTPEQKIKHQVAMDKVLADVREYVTDTKRILATIKNPELRKAALRE
jgi:hypothetical protein